MGEQFDPAQVAVDDLVLRVAGGDVAGLAGHEPGMRAPGGGEGGPDAGRDGEQFAGRGRAQRLAGGGGYQDRVPVRGGRFAGTKSQRTDAPLYAADRGRETWVAADLCAAVEIGVLAQWRQPLLRHDGQATGGLAGRAVGQRPGAGHGAKRDAGGHEAEPDGQRTPRVAGAPTADVSRGDAQSAFALALLECRLSTALFDTGWDSGIGISALVTGAFRHLDPLGPEPPSPHHRAGPRPASTSSARANSPVPSCAWELPRGSARCSTPGMRCQPIPAGEP